MILIVSGPAASGKSRHVVEIARKTGWPVFSIGDYRRSNRSWRDLVGDVRETEGVAIVECVALPSPLRSLMQERGWILAWVACPEEERQRRLEERKRMGMLFLSDLDGRYDNSRHAVVKLSGVGDESSRFKAQDQLVELVESRS